MPWLERLDARAKDWPVFARWPYRSVKVLLIAMGVYLAAALAVTEFQQGRFGMGLGITIAGSLAIIKGVITALRSSPASPRRH